MTLPVPRRVLAVSGSLRARSINTAALLAAQALAPAGIEVTLFPGVGDLPHFNPDLDTPVPPAPVAAWRTAVAGADCLLFSTPEYAHGLPGAFKNALDWLVSFEGFVAKPVAIIAARPGGDHAQAALREILTVMNARLLAGACVTLPLTTNTHDVAALLGQPAVRGGLGACLQSIAGHLRPS
ncbi:MAG TPA: NADPH-dependent FMN reductase [Lacunisphaera sp.]|nr:NADPH-dependent FMN reductase [Lacunisphaera sp.]